MVTGHSLCNGSRATQLHLKQRNTLTAGNVGALMKSTERAYPLRVIRVVLTERRAPPVYPDKQTSSESVGMSQRCQKRKHWIEQLYFRLASWAVFTVRNGLDHPI